MIKKGLILSVICIPLSGFATMLTTPNYPQQPGYNLSQSRTQMKMMQQQQQQKMKLQQDQQLQNQRIQQQLQEQRNSAQQSLNGPTYGTTPLPSTQQQR